VIAPQLWCPRCAANLSARARCVQFLDDGAVRGYVCAACGLVSRWVMDERVHVERVAAPPPPRPRWRWYEKALLAIVPWRWATGLRARRLARAGRGKPSRRPAVVPKKHLEARLAGLGWASLAAEPAEEGHYDALCHP
jgi:hypothetical protein